ncbi:magnesium transporter [Delphinella strobiligena]|nr:magnesium transporter [Delphinella strobiligena]
MGLISTLLNILGVVLLAHAVYSAHEHSLLTSALPTHALSPSNAPKSSLAMLHPKVDLPLDITIETLISVLLLCTGVVLGSPDLKPIQWRVWAGKLEREKLSQRSDELGPRGNPYKALEERQSFLDIRKARREFADWVKEGGNRDKDVEQIQ